ncbi:unnamed protein product [Paramecium sonneborni]|uniref:Uncharacterized protein n=1 Tax=Paramecium sonneborni TaxID=65129 RepID=A0A8S1RL77_9CILI|nr:unnamed protein product [Paramecium sonneborni]
MKQDSKRHKSSYYKLSQHIRQTLIHLICLKGFKIKKAANFLNIKYAAAKSIFQYYRKNIINNKQSIDSKNRCLYRIVTNEIVNFQIITKIAGEYVNSKTVYSTSTQT